MLDAGDHIRLEPFHLAAQLDVLDPHQQRLQHQSQFEPREMRAGAEMLAPAEGDVFVWSAFNVKAIRIIEDCLVSIRRRKP